MWDGVLGTAVWGGSAESGELYYFCDEVYTTLLQCAVLTVFLPSSTFRLYPPVFRLPIPVSLSYRMVDFFISEGLLSLFFAFFLGRGCCRRCHRHPRPRPGHETTGSPRRGRTNGNGSEGAGVREQWSRAAKHVAHQRNADGANHRAPRGVADGPAASGAEAQVLWVRHLDGWRRRHVSVVTTEQSTGKCFGSRCDVVLL